LVVLKFVQLIQIELGNGLLLFERLLRHRIPNQNCWIIGVQLVQAKLHLLLVSWLVELVLKFSHILVVKRGIILDISL
jgi:hypothetical protein